MAVALAVTALAGTLIVLPAASSAGSSTSVASTGRLVVNGTRTVKVDRAALGGVRSLASDAESYCALLLTGRIDCWGSDVDGQLGNGRTNSSDVPVAVKKITNATSVAGATDDEDYCAVLSTGKVDCWGYGGEGELGDGTTTAYSDVPVAVTGITNAKSVISDNIGADGYCVLLRTGRVDCWGLNDWGELGNGTLMYSDVPVAVKGITDAKVVTGNDFSFSAVLLTGRIDCWGKHLSTVSSDNSEVPVAVKRITNATAVAGDGSNSYCAVLKTGKMACWGYGYDGELGNGRFYTSNPMGSRAPVAVKEITNARAVTYFSAPSSTAGGFCALLSTGKVDCWGYGADGELGNGSTTHSDVPVAVKKITDATSVADDAFLGYCAVLKTGRVDCWGYNQYGELGNGSYASPDVPVAVKKITNAKVVTGDGYESYCAVLKTARVDCWGEGMAGQLGNGRFYTSSPYGSDVPVAVLAPA